LYVPFPKNPKSVNYIPQNSVSALLCKLKLHTKPTVITVIKIKTIKTFLLKCLSTQAIFVCGDLINSDLFKTFKLRHCSVYLVLVVVWLALASHNMWSPVALINQVMPCTMTVEGWSKLLCITYEKLRKSFFYRKN